MSELQASFPGPLPYKESPTIGQPDSAVKLRHIPHPKEPLNFTFCKVVLVPAGPNTATLVVVSEDANYSKTTISFIGTYNNYNYN